MTEIILNPILCFKLPNGVQMSAMEKKSFEDAALEFMHWHLNEYVRNRTGLINFFGPCGMESRYKAHEKDAQ